MSNSLNNNEFNVIDFINFKKILKNITIIDEVEPLQMNIDEFVCFLINERFINTKKLNKESIEILSYIIYQYYMGKNKIVVSSQKQFDLIGSISDYLDKIWWIFKNNIKVGKYINN